MVSRTVSRGVVLFQRRKMSMRMLAGKPVSFSVMNERMLPGGVNGNTAEFGSAFPGSSPGWAARLRRILWPIIS